MARLIASKKPEFVDLIKYKLRLKTYKRLSIISLIINIILVIALINK